VRDGWPPLAKSALVPLAMVVSVSRREHGRVSLAIWLRWEILQGKGIYYNTTIRVQNCVLYTGRRGRTHKSVGLTDRPPGGELEPEREGVRHPSMLN